MSDDERIQCENCLGTKKAGETGWVKVGFGEYYCPDGCYERVPAEAGASLTRGDDV